MVDSGFLILGPWKSLMVAAEGMMTTFSTKGMIRTGVIRGTDPSITHDGSMYVW